MKKKRKITLRLPDLSPEAAYVVSGLVEDLAHKVDLYYADEIRSLLQMREHKVAETGEIAQEKLEQQELDFDDPIPF